MEEHERNDEEERLLVLLGEIGEENALNAAATLLAASFHGVDPFTFRAKLSELITRLVAASLHPDGTFCTGIVLPLVEAALVAAAMIAEAMGNGTDPAGETVTPRYLAEMMAERLASADAAWPMMQGTAAMIRGAMGFDDAAETAPAPDAETARAFRDEYRELSGGSDDAAEDDAAARDAAGIAALNALLGLDYDGPMQ